MRNNDLKLMTVEQLRRALQMAVEDGNDIYQYVIKKELKSREETGNGPSAA